MEEIHLFTAPLVLDTVNKIGGNYTSSMTVATFAIPMKDGVNLHFNIVNESGRAIATNTDPIILIHQGPGRLDVASLREEPDELLQSFYELVNQSTKAKKTAWAYNVVKCVGDDCVVEEVWADPIPEPDWRAEKVQTIISSYIPLATVKELLAEGTISNLLTVYTMYYRGELVSAGMIHNLPNARFVVRVIQIPPAPDYAVITVNEEPLLERFDRGLDVLEGTLNLPAHALSNYVYVGSALVEIPEEQELIRMGVNLDHMFH